jgi:hypothetical protein
VVRFGPRVCEFPRRFTWLRFTRLVLAPDEQVSGGREQLVVRRLVRVVLVAPAVDPEQAEVQRSTWAPHNAESCENVAHVVAHVQRREGALERAESQLQHDRVHGLCLLQSVDAHQALVLELDVLCDGEVHPNAVFPHQLRRPAPPRVR